ncbi:hypothetical protein OAX78_04660 [Planctomycetota bacterium]|nr:hypothetical protein [Planctomycetota bacterium]
MRRHLVLVTAVALLCLVGCAGPPPIVDMTPRFSQGTSRVESVQMFATLDLPLIDLSTHVGFSWNATVLSAGPQGTTIEAAVTRALVDIPGITVDTDSIIPFGSLGVGALFFELIGARFRYVIDPMGQVSVTGWSAALAGAASAAEVIVPDDGSVPPEEELAAALTRVYSVLPRRQIALEEGWNRPSAYQLANADGPKIESTDAYAYTGFGEETFDFGSDDVTIEGLAAPFRGQPEVVIPGVAFYGLVDLQMGRRSGDILLNERGDTIRLYREVDTMSLSPAQALDLDVDLANLDTGWIFHAPRDWR